MTTLPPGLVLPSPPRSAGSYRPAVIAGGFVFLSGFGPRDDNGTPVRGVVGADLTVDAARLLARNVGLSILSVLQDALGDLGKVRQVVKVTGMINAVPGFTEHPRVIDGCSEVLVEVLGRRGEHARAAHGVSSLPSGAPVSIECVCQVAP